MDDLKDKIRQENQLFFMRWNNAQQRFLYAVNNRKQTPRRRLFEAGNKSGKTHVGLSEDLAHAFGYRPWLKESDPFYKIDIRVPNQGLIAGETMMHSVMSKIWPTLKYELIPKTCKWKAKKNPQGQIQRIEFETGAFGEPCGSTIFLRSYDQEADTYEGIDYHWVHWDEPPPKAITQAAERGKVVTNAPSWWTMTPLKEAYIYDEYSLKAGNMGGEDDEISVIRGEIWENCSDWCNNCQMAITGIDCPSCNHTAGFIPRAGIEEYLKTLDPEEREAREKGLWKHLSGLVYKMLDRDIHLYDDFDIPRSWMKLEGIDPHDAKPVCYLFAAVSPEEVEVFGKMRNRIYVYDYLLVKEDLDSLTRKIKAKREEHGYSKPRWIELDAKYGRREQMENRCWEDELQKRSLGFIRLSQSKPGDVEIGHKVVREYLKPHYSRLTETTKAGLLFAKGRCSGAGGPIHQMFNYQYRENRDEPDKEFKDFPDIVRYLCLEEPVYRSPLDEKKVIDMLVHRQKTAIEQRRNIGVLS